MGNEPPTADSNVISGRDGRSDRPPGVGNGPPGEETDTGSGRVDTHRRDDTGLDDSSQAGGTDQGHNTSEMVGQSM